MSETTNPSPAFSVEVRDQDGVPVVFVRGEVDVHTAPQLRETVRRLLDDGASTLLVDMEQTEFIDSTGLGVLLGAAKELQQAGGRFTLARPSKAVSKILSVTGMSELFDVT